MINFISINTFLNYIKAFCNRLFLCLTFQDTWGRFHEKSQTEPDSRLSQGLKSETFVSAEFLAQMDFTKGGSAETSRKLWSQLFNLISYI